MLIMLGNLSVVELSLLILALLMFLVFLAVITYKTHSSKVTTGNKGLVGKHGVATTKINPRGKVFVEGEIWDAFSNLSVNKGDKVLILQVNGLKLEVEKTKK